MKTIFKIIATPRGTQVICSQVFDGTITVDGVEYYHGIGTRFNKNMEDSLDMINQIPFAFTFDRDKIPALKKTVNRVAKEIKLLKEI